MDMSQLDVDFFTRIGSYTPHFYRDVYPSIDPSRPELSQSNKVVIVTGASAGIGAEGIAPAFAQAGARAIVLVARRKGKVGEVAASLRKRFPSVDILEVGADIGDTASVQALFETVKNKVGTADVLINNAGTLNEGELVAGDPKAWWSNFEINVHGTYLITKQFLKMLGPSKRGSIISLSSGAARAINPGHSGYGLTKLIIAKLGEWIGAEHPNVTSVALDPGIINTDMMFDQMRRFAVDTHELVGGTVVWLATEPAAFLNGRYICASWSVDELMERKQAILESDDLKFVLQGKFGA